MSTTTIRLPEELRSRIALAAERAGTTAHGFILEAIAEKADAAERRFDLEETAKRRFATIVATGKSIPWSSMRDYVDARVAGKRAKPPVARKAPRKK